MNTTTHIIPETGYEVCLIGLPEGAGEIKLMNLGRTKGISLAYIMPDNEHLHVVLDGFDWQLLSTFSEITEEKLEGIIPEHDGKFLDFTDNGVLRWSEPTRVESLKSLMDFLQCYTVNPYGELYKAIRSGTARSKDGAEKDRGHIVHLVGNNDYPSWQTAICGIHPRGNGWHYYTDGQEVSCERCLAKSVGFIEAQSRTFADYAICVRTVNK